MEKDDELNEIQIQYRDSVYEKQRDFITNKILEFTKLDVPKEWIWAFIYAYYSTDYHSKFYNYIKGKDRNILFERKFINTFAKSEEIRFEDAIAVLIDFLNRNLIPINMKEYYDLANKGWQKDLDNTLIKFVRFFC